jgi:multidrug resistance efflux pump
MLELFLCSLVTIVPDYLFRRYAQGKRLGHEITLFSVWYELRWGLTMCFILTTLLITVILYNHPSSRSVAPLFRAIPILPETNGRVAEIYVQRSSAVEKGQPIFRLDRTKQEAALETSRRRLAEIDASMTMAKAEIAAAEGEVVAARGELQQAVDELARKQELVRRDANVVAPREIERLLNTVSARQGQLDAAIASKDAATTRYDVLLPAERKSAEAAAHEAQVDLDKTTVYAGVAGRVEQFVLQVGDVVNPLMRPAGVLVPEESGRNRLQAGFNQIEAQVLKPGMAAEATCVSKPLTIIPLVVTSVQDYIAAGQIRSGEQLVEVQNIARPGTILVFLDPLFEGGLDGVTPGSTCIANVYTSNHEALKDPNIGLLRWLYLHMVDTVALVHAMILRIQALFLPLQTLVFGGH